MNNAMPADRDRSASTSEPAVERALEAPGARAPARLIAIVGASTALLFIVMALHASPLEPSVPQLQMTFSEAAFRTILAQWQPSGVARFAWHIAIDFPFLVAYGLFGYVLYRHGFQSLPVSERTRAILSWTLPLAAVLDAAENLLHLSFIVAAQAPAVLFFFAGVIATLKWALFLGFALATAFNAMRRVF